MNADRIGVAWSDDTEGQHEIYFQDFDRRLRSRGDVHRITTTARSSLIPAIRPWQSGYALAWNEYEQRATASHDAAGHRGQSEIAVVLIR